MSTLAADAWPDRLSVNAWTGGAPVTSSLAATKDTQDWAIRRHFHGRPEVLMAASEAGLEEWQDPDVGWGLVLPDYDPNLNLSSVDRAKAADAPEPVRELARVRAGGGEPVVLRYRDGADTLFRCYSDGEERPIPLHGVPRGTAPGYLPRYLLLCGGPDVLPWQLQLRLNLAAFTGRLDLDETGLSRYIGAALNDWADSAAEPDAPLVWTVEHENGDITWLMRQAIADQVFRKWQSDGQLAAGARRLAGAEATAEALARELAEHPPGVVVTTSHGMTGPLDDPDAMRRNLGLPVGIDLKTVTPEQLLADWQPDGVVWYSHACCSAGTSGTNIFDGLVDRDGEVQRTLVAVASLGPTSAPLPRALLGAEHPARAFIGHIEPTFDWTLRRRGGPILIAALLKALYTRFHLPNPSPVGRAFADYHAEAAALLAEWGQVRDDHFGQGADASLSATTIAQLTGLDRQCTVILGDPAVAPKALPTV